MRAPTRKSAEQLASARRAATERALDLSEGRECEPQELQLANGLEPVDRQCDGRRQRFGRQETARKARIFAIRRGGMPTVVSRLSRGVSAVTAFGIERSGDARLLVTAMPRSRMVVQRMDRRRSRQIIGKRQDDKDPL
jgi:hypothetical protein